MPRVGVYALALVKCLFITSMLIFVSINASAVTWKKSDYLVSSTLVCSVKSIEKLIQSQSWGFQEVFIFEITSNKEKEKSKKLGKDVFYGHQYYLAPGIDEDDGVRVVPAYTFFHRTLYHLKAYGGFGMLTTDGISTYLSINRETLEAEYVGFGLKYQCSLYKLSQREEALSQLQKFVDAWESWRTQKEKRNKI